MAARNEALMRAVGALANMLTADRAQAPRAAQQCNYGLRIVCRGGLPGSRHRLVQPQLDESRDVRGGALGA